MNYPEWVPEQIATLDWEFFGDREALEVSEDVLRSQVYPEFSRAVNIFASESRLEAVWKRFLKQKFEAYPGEHMWELYGVVYEGLTRTTSFADQEPMHIRDRKLRQLQAATRKLAGLVKKAHIEGFLPNFASKHFQRSEVEGHVEIGYSDIYLEEIFAILERQAEKLVGVKGILPKVQKDDKDRKVAYFILDLHKHFLNNFGKYLDELVADLVSIFFNKDVGREFVRARRQVRKSTGNEIDPRRITWE